MLVTSYYDIYNKPEGLLYYKKLFDELAFSGLPVIVFTDPSLEHNFSDYPETIKIISVPLKDFELYSIAMDYNGELPNNRNVNKDTKEFLALMNTKIEFVAKASREIELVDDTFIWIDFGILKIIHNKDAFINKLKIINNTVFDKITIPGCWNIGTHLSMDSVNWRFCGGLFIIPRKHIDTFCTKSKNVLTYLCTEPEKKLIWETNVWNIIEYHTFRDIIHWYKGDHNDTILPDIDNLISEHSVT
jgi:hypothetical protein